MTAVSYPVIPEQQSSSNTCWLYCIRMLAAYRRWVGRPLDPLAAALLQPDIETRFAELNRPLNPHAFAAIAGRFGLSAIDRVGVTRAPRGTELDDPLAAHDVLRTRGPFTMGVLSRGAGHAIVVCGANDYESLDIEFIDPADGSWDFLSLERFRATYPPDGGPLFVF